MRILEVSEHYFPHVGGISEHVYALAKQLQQRGHEVEVLTSAGRGYVPGDVAVINIGRGVLVPINKSFSRMALGLGIPARVNRLLRDRRYHVVHVHGSLAPMFPMTVLRFLRCIPDTAAVATFHACHGPSVLYRIFKRPMRRHYFSCYDGLIAVSPAAEQTMAHFFPADYRIIPNGVDTDVFSPGESSFSERLPDSSLKLLFVGRYEPKKGLRYLLAALRLIKRRVPDVKLVVVAAGHMGSYYNRFITEDITDSVVQVGEVVGAERREYYRWCDITVAPSIGAESFGITLLEAMACGKPVVASDIPAFRYVMGPEEGQFFKPCDYLDLARAILRLYGRRKDWPKMGKAERRKALAYNWPRVAGMVEDYFIKVRGNRGSKN